MSDFHKRRGTGIGGSDVGPILGVDRYRTALDIWAQKVNPPTEQGEPNQAMLRGQYMEPLVAQLYREQSGRKTRRGPFRRHRTRKYLVGHPDYLISAIGQSPWEGHDAPGVLECKTAGRAAFARMKTEGLPESYILQLNHYMGVTGCTWGVLAVLCPDPWEFIAFEIDFDEDLFDRVADVLDSFWHDNVKAKRPPEAMDPQAWADAPPIPEGEEVVLRDDERWAAAVQSYRETHEVRKLGEAGEKFAKETLKMLCSGDDGTPHHGVFQGGGVRVYYRQSPGRTTFNKKALLAAEPIDPITLASKLAAQGMGLDQIQSLLEGSRLDLSAFEKTGKPFETLRIYDTRGDDNG